MKTMISALMLALASTVNAQQQSTRTCDTVENMLEQLQKRHQEHPVWIGSRQETGHDWILFANERTRTWTMVVTDRTSMCVISWGQDYALSRPSSTPLKNISR